MKTTEARMLAARSRLDRTTADPVAADIAKLLIDEAKEDVTRAQAQSILGAALFRSGDMDGAVEAFTKADNVMKENADHQFWFGMTLLQKNDPEGAKTRLKSVVDLSRNGTAQSALADRLSLKAIEQIEKLEPGYQAKLPETAKPNVADSQPKKDPTKVSEKPVIRKVLPPLIEDDGPQPIATDVNRNR